MLKRIVIISLVAALLAMGLFVKQRFHEPLKVSGMIEADEIRVGSRVGGRVARVAVEEGARVKTGEVIVELEPFDLLQRRAEAQAQLASARAEHQKLTAGFRPEEIAQAKAKRDQLAARVDKFVNGPRAQEIASAEAQLSLFKAQQDLAMAEFKRTEALFGGRVSSQDQYDKAKSQLKIAQENVATQEHKLAELREGTRAEEIVEAKAMLEEAEQAYLMMTNGYRAEDIAQVCARADAAQAALGAIEEQIKELGIRAPTDGVVEAVEIQPGDMIGANAPAVSIMDTTHYWVRAYLPENNLDITLGDKIPVTVDSFPGEEFMVRVTFIARQAEFTPGNVQTPEERSKQVFRIKASFENGIEKLRPGMSADLWLDRVEPAL